MNSDHLVRVVLNHNIERLWHMPLLYQAAPGKAYVMSAFRMEFFDKLQHTSGLRFIDTCEPVRDGDLPLWDGTASLDDKRVGYAHDGALGDECVHTSIYRQLALDYPAVDLHVFAGVEYHNARLLMHNKDIGGVPRYRHIGLSAEEIASMDYWILPASVGYQNRGTETNIYELWEKEIGMRIALHRPYLYLQGQERQRVREMIRQYFESTVPAEQVATVLDWFWDAPIVLQVNAREEARTPPPHIWRSLVYALRRIYPAKPIVVCGDRRHVYPLLRAMHELQVGNIFPFLSDPLDLLGIHLSASGLLHLIQAASLVICPDSYFLHAAAAFDVPTVALWQTDPAIIEEARIPPPASRLASYANAMAIPMVSRIDDMIATIQQRGIY